MSSINFTAAIETQQSFIAKILRTTKGGWICSIGDAEVFLPGSQLYKEIDDYESVVGKSVKVMVQRADRNGVVVSHKYYRKYNYERKTILESLERGQKLIGIIKGIVDNGYQIDVLGIIGFMPKDAALNGSLMNIGDNIEFAVLKSDPEKSNLILSAKLLKEIEEANKRKEERELRNRQEEQRRSHFVNYINNEVIPNNLVLIGRVVFIERDLVTIHINYNGSIYSAYIRKEELAWEKIQNAADVVFLGEELQVKFSHFEKKKPYFNFKWQQIDLYPSDLFYMNTDELLSTAGVSENLFVAKATITRQFDDEEKETISAYASNFITLGEGDNNTLFIDKYTGVNISAKISSRYAYGLEDGNYYRFKLKAAKPEKRLNEHRPYMFVAELDGGAISLPNPFKNLVEKSFRENKTPKSNREAASYLKEIGADMYTDRDRMFYELLQNADDASSKRGVKVMVQIKDNYLIFTHDGLSFSRQDFRSIVSTANSTKRLDRKKTGYKGIGFKSVFTDSEKVYIKTGGFFFLFNKDAEIFNDFRAFYRYVNPLYTEDQLEIFFEENEEYEKEFEKVDHLPWQLLPFWVDECPQPLQNTTFSRKCNVAIALDMGVKAEKYKDTIIGIIQKPRFMLFLRNTQRIQYEDKKWEILSIAKQTDSISNVVKLKNSFASNDMEVSYIVREGSDIHVTNEAFDLCNIPMIKECTMASGREKWTMYQIVDGTKAPITSIPERIIAADTTTLSYAIMLDEGGHAIPILDKTPSLYAYLPMEDRRYLFPFFINADFELSSNRQEAKRVSVWNEYIFYNIGKNIVKWVSSLANISHPKYLELLPQSFFTEELEESKTDRLATQFNRGYKESLIDTPFILNDKGNVVCQKDILIDESEFANVIGSEDFCKLWGGQKRILNKNIDIDPLKNKEIFSEIEHLQSNEIVDFIINPKNRKKILHYWCAISADLRKAILTHIVKMPGNKKNLFDYLLDIPAYCCNGRLLSFKKLLQSNDIIIRTDFIAGIEDIIEILGFSITDEIESEHPFHSKMEEEMTSYAIHIFEIISKRTSQSQYKLSSADKIKLFRHFASAKKNIEHEKLCEWQLFCNQKDNVVPLSMLTHINSTLYNGITKQFVINKEEYDEDPKLIDRYLMKEKNQYEKIVVHNWSSLASEVGNDEKKACSLYKLATITYAVAEHEQVNERYSCPILNYDFVFANSSMHSISSVIINDNLSANEKAKSVVEKITGSLIPTSMIVKAIQSQPFECKNQSLDSIILLPNMVLNLEEVESLLHYCLANNETLFTQYSINKTEEGYTFAKLSNNSFTAYTNDTILNSFIQDNCSSLMLLPKELSKYCSLKGILTDDELLLKILEIIKDVKGHSETLLPIYKNSVSKVKTSYISHLSSIGLNDQSCKDEDDIWTQTLLLASTIEKPDESLFVQLRNKIYITSGEITTALSDIKQEHTLEINGKSFPLSKLLPNEDNLARLVDTLRERIEEHVSTVFISKLFGGEVDKGRASSVFMELNKPIVVLENGAQIAFVLDYSNLNNIKGITCKVLDTNEIPQPHALCGNWILHSYSFIDNSYILNEKYWDLAKYLSLPYTNLNNQCIIRQDLSGFNYLKDTLNNEESHDLLNVILQKTEANQGIMNEDVIRIKNSLGITNLQYIISEKYFLEDEKLPDNIESWRISDKTDEKTNVICNVFGVLNEASDVVCVRKYLSEGTPLPPIKNKSNLSELTCKWIAVNKLKLNDIQYLQIRDVLDVKDYVIEKNYDLIKQYESQDFYYMKFADYSVYLHDGEIPWVVKFQKNNYVFHQYKEGNVALFGYNIYINNKEKDNIAALIRSIVNTSNFSTDDFFKFFEVYQSRLSGSLEGEFDDDQDEEARNAANDNAKQEAINWLQARNYDTSHVEINKSLLKGIKKDNVEYHIVVKSYRNREKGLKINPNEWLYLLNENSRLMIYMSHMAFAVFDRKMLLGNHDFLKLRISTSNFDIESGKLDEVISRLARDIQFFERTHFIFEHIHDDILSEASSLDDYNFYNSNSAGQFTAANDGDIL